MAVAYVRETHIVNYDFGLRACGLGTYRSILSS